MPRAALREECFFAGDTWTHLPLAHPRLRFAPRLALTIREC
jgi:hypothetical protein